MSNKPLTLAEKLWRDHLVVKGENGAPDLIYIDLHLIHEVTSPQAFDGLRLAGRQLRRKDLTIATEDHNTPTQDIHLPIADLTSRTQVQALRDNTAEFGVRIHSLGDKNQGIVHVVGPQLNNCLWRLSHLDPRSFWFTWNRHWHQRGRARHGNPDLAAGTFQDHGNQCRGNSSSRR